MKNFIYKCIPVSIIIDNGKNIHKNAVLVYEKLINNISSDSWELVTIDRIFPALSSTSN